MYYTQHCICSVLKAFSVKTQLANTTVKTHTFVLHSIYKTEVQDYTSHEIEMELQTTIIHNSLHINMEVTLFHQDTKINSCFYLATKIPVKPHTCETFLNQLVDLGGALILLSIIIKFCFKPFKRIYLQNHLS